MRRIAALTAATLADLVAILPISSPSFIGNVAVSAAAGYAATPFFLFISIGTGLTSVLAPPFASPHGPFSAS
jgi:hypothetical protein